MANIIACRVGLYGPLETAFEYLPQAGITHAEVAPPNDGDYDGLLKLAQKYGITISTVATGLSLETEETMKKFWSVIDGTAAIGTKKMFISVSGGETKDRAALIGRLRETAAYAEKKGVVLGMETHPPFGTNGDVAKETITEINNPHLRYNFDTANIYYYNEGADSVAELKKVTDLVSSVHLKDTQGKFKDFDFPVLGKGIVDFPEVFRILNAQGFTGPFTLEIEGEVIKGKDLEGKHQVIVDCVSYLKSIGAAV